MRDVLFLDAHPGWTYADLMDTPEDVVEVMRRLDAKKATK
jgi:hypothetical protein